MPQTPRMKWTYPKKDANPWFDQFVALLGSQDASAHAAVETSNQFVMGDLSFGGDTLSWDADLYIMSPLTGFLHTLPEGAVEILDGQMLYVSLARNLTNNATLTPLVGSSRPDSVALENFFVIAVRKGNTVYTQTGTVGAGGGGGGGSSTPLFPVTSVHTTNFTASANYLNLVSTASNDPLEVMLPLASDYTNGEWVAIRRVAGPSDSEISVVVDDDDGDAEDDVIVGASTLTADQDSAIYVTDGIDKWYLLASTGSSGDGGGGGGGSETPPSEKMRFYDDFVSIANIAVTGAGSVTYGPRSGMIGSFVVTNTAGQASLAGPKTAATGDSGQYLNFQPGTLTMEARLQMTAVGAGDVRIIVGAHDGDSTGAFPASLIGFSYSTGDNGNSNWWAWVLDGFGLSTTHDTGVSLTTDPIRLKFTANRGGSGDTVFEIDGVVVWTHNGGTPFSLDLGTKILMKSLAAGTFAYAWDWLDVTYEMAR